MLLRAYEYGPNPGYAGVPGEDGTCVACHSGSGLNAGAGSVTVSFPNGLQYTPGVTQHWTVTIADPAQHVWGFELTTRQASSASTVAGTFHSTDNHTQLMCSQSNLFIFQQVAYTSGSQTCPSNDPLIYVEHNLAGYNATKGTTGSATYQFDWTPPSTNVGNIVVYAAGNAANGDLTPNGDHVYAVNYTLAPAVAALNPPTISSVSNALTGSLSGVFPGSFVAIQGTNLTSGPHDDWSKSITSDGHLPTSLDDVVSITMGGAPAYIYAITPTQINVQAPDLAEGPIQVVVTTTAGSSTAFGTIAHLYGPAFVPWPNNQPGATHADFSYAVKNGTFQVTTVPSKPGETISLWGTGFGPTSPAAPAGREPGSSAAAKLQGSLIVTLNGSSIPAVGAISQYTGDYQINVTIPASLADGDYPLIATVNGASSPTYTLTVQH
jgi:uncharacterized protein (TIGR03437 family)